jgi:hypothetical protein
MRPTTMNDDESSSSISCRAAAVVVARILPRILIIEGYSRVLIVEYVRYTSRRKKTRYVVHA